MNWNKSVVTRSSTVVYNRAGAWPNDEGPRPDPYHTATTLVSFKWAYRTRHYSHSHTKFDLKGFD